MKEIILLKDGEIALKGLNRHAFEDRLIKNARRKLMPVGSFHFKKAQSTIYVEPDREDYDLDEAVERLHEGVRHRRSHPRLRGGKGHRSHQTHRSRIFKGGSWKASRPLRWRPSARIRRFPMKSPAICRGAGGVSAGAVPAPVGGCARPGRDRDGGDPRLCGLCPRRTDPRARAASRWAPAARRCC